MRVENDKRIWKYQHFFECVTKEISGWRQQATFVFVLQISKCFHNYVRWVVRTKQNKVGRVKIRTHGDFVDIVDNKSPVARELFLQAVDQLSFWKWLHVMMSRSLQYHHMASAIIDHHHHRRNDNKSKNGLILPTGQWYAPSAVIDDAWYCMVLHGIAWYCMVLHGIAW